MLYLQDQAFSESYSTHEALVLSFSESIKGYGSYAFASASGVKVLFQDKEFNSLLDRGGYSIVVGIDEITDIRCLECLSDIAANNPNFKVQAYLNQEKGVIFHPKFSFFESMSGNGTIVIGSGNLTLGGLRKNKEAFSIMPLSSDEFDRMEMYWCSWLSEASQSIKDINDDQVIEKARQNIYQKKARSPIQDLDTAEIIAKEGEVGGLEAPIIEGWHFDDNSQVLLAEIPKSGNRWKQANFDVGTFQNFFGATVGNKSQRVLLRSVKDDATLSSIEIRPSVSVKSKNYRFELDAATGLLYPHEKAPIGVFIRLTTRMFLYHIFMPDNVLYNEITCWMNHNWSGRADRMKRIVTTAQELGGVLNRSVFSHYKV